MSHGYKLGGIMVVLIIAGVKIGMVMHDHNEAEARRNAAYVNDPTLTPEQNETLRRLHEQGFDVRFEKSR